MNLRPLIIDATARERAARIVAHAEAHHYIPGPGVPPPGDDPNFAGMFDTFRVVFSITHSNVKLFRHISISVPGGKLPNPVAAYTLAELFGFTGWDGKTITAPDGWMIGLEEVPNKCVIIAQQHQSATVH